jgi:hypothetical protein
MIVQPSGDLKFGDSQGLQYWLQDHNMVHWNLCSISAGTSNPVQFVDFTGAVDNNWITRHHLQHQALVVSLLTPAAGLTPTSVLDVPDLNDEYVFYHWMQAHNDLHRQFDEALGLT